MMKRHLTILTVLCLTAISARAQDTTAVREAVPLRKESRTPCRPRPVNDYDGLNSLMRRLANPGWDGLVKDIHTGLRLDGGRIRPLRGTGNADAAETSETSSGSYAGENAEPLNGYLREMEKGEAAVGPPVYVFFRLAGTYITDSPQLLNIQAAADLAKEKNLRVRITGAADSATGAADKNAVLATSRAEHVANLMKQRGVPDERIEVRSEGGTAEYSPVVANRNCRIELFIQ